MVVFDANFLILAFDKNAASKESWPRLQERIDMLLSDLGKARNKILIPTPALSEFLTKADPGILQIIHISAGFKIAPFDERAAIEAAIMTKDAIRRSNKKDPVVAATWAKVKFDRQIVAIAKVEGVDPICSTDPDIERHARRVGIECLGIPDLPIPPPVQEKLPYESPQAEATHDLATSPEEKQAMDENTDGRQR